MILPLLLACGPDGSADDVCALERVEDDIDAGVWSIGAALPGSAGQVKVRARWPDQPAGGRWPVALVLQGAWDPIGTALERTSPRPDVAPGIVSLHLDLPGNGGTEGENDRRGPASRAAVAAVLQWAAGELRDLGGCTLADRVPGADPTALYVIGASNGGNLAIAALSDSTLAVPEVAGLILWETPAGPTFVNVELGISPTVYEAGACRYTPENGIVCDFPEERLYANLVDGTSVLCFDEDADATCGEGDVLVPGVVDLSNGDRVVSPALARAADARGVLPDGFADASTADTWWSERDGSRLAPALVGARPTLPVLLLASEADHVQSLSDHPHVFGLGEALQAAGVFWLRLNPGAPWLEGVPQENLPNAPLRLASPSGALLPEDVEEPLSDLFTASIFELFDRRASADW
jgi:hypothetical protein